MKYDFSRCNNLRWECGDETERHNGFFRVFDDRDGGRTLSLIERINMPYGLQRDINFACLSLNRDRH